MDHRLLEQKTMPNTKTNLIRLAAAAVLFGASGAVLAFPCYQGYVDVSPSDPVEIDVDLQSGGDDFECIDGVAGTNNDSADLLNNTDTNEDGIDGFFNLSDWAYIDRFNTDGGNDGYLGLIEISNPTETDSTGQPLAGNWAFTTDVWAEYSDLLIVLKDGGRCPDPSNPDCDNLDLVKWSAYKVGTDVVPYPMAGDWSMGALDSVTGALSHITLYGIRCDEPDGCGGEPPGETPIPAPIALLGLGSLLLAWRGRKSLS